MMYRKDSKVIVQNNLESQNVHEKINGREKSEVHTVISHMTTRKLFRERY